MSISQAGSSDIPSLLPLVNRAYRGEGSDKGWTNESHLLRGPRTDADSLARLMIDPGSMFLKYTAPDHTLAGCVYMQQQGEKLYMGMLSVLPERQGDGVGKRLMAAVEEHARKLGCGSIRITVLAPRLELIGWYERHGYKRTGETEPFPTWEKFGIQDQPLELVVLEAPISGV